VGAAAVEVTAVRIVVVTAAGIVVVAVGVTVVGAVAVAVAVAGTVAVAAAAIVVVTVVGVAWLPTSASRRPHEATRRANVARATKSRNVLGRGSGVFFMGPTVGANQEKSKNS